MANFNVACPQCNTTLEVPAELAGQNVGCPTCGTSFVVPAPAAAATVAAAPAPMQQAGAMFNNGMAAAGNFAGNTAKKIKAFSAAASASAALLALVALFVAIVALVYSIFFVEGAPKVKFSKDPKTACKAYLEYQWQDAALANYSYDKNYKELLSNMSFDEVATNGDYAVVFYSIKKGASSYKDVMQLKKNKDGYYMMGWGSAKNIDSEWSGKMLDKVVKYKEGSVKLDTLFD